MLSEHKHLLFNCAENARKEEKEKQVNPSYQGANHLLAETSEYLHVLKVVNVVSSWISRAFTTYL